MATGNGTEKLQLLPGRSDMIRKSVSYALVREQEDVPRGEDKPKKRRLVRRISALNSSEDDKP